MEQRHILAQVATNLRAQTHKVSGTPGPPAEPVALTPVAQYLRMSTEHQQYSIENQERVIRDYAMTHRLRVVETYADPGKSGLTLKGRPGLNRLLLDIMSGNFPYKAVLVYDISRWGRFQDVDEAAHYEFVCRAAGIPVYYCAEQFLNDGSALHSINKAVKRAMAAEYSRELGISVFEAKRRLAQCGLWVGGQAPYGLRRMIISADQKRRAVLELGEHKNLRIDQEILVPGPRSEVSYVRRMYEMVLRNGMNCSEIARALNRRGVTHSERPWSPASVHNILTNPLYTGCNVWNRTNQKLHRPTIHLSSESWIRCENAFAAIVDPRNFELVQAAFRKRRAERLWSEQRILKRLRWLLTKKGMLTDKLIEDTPGMPRSRTIRARFGSHRRVYELLHYLPSKRVVALSDAIRRALDLRNKLVSQVLDRFPGVIDLLPRRGRLSRPVFSVDKAITLSVLLCPTVRTPNGHLRWRLIPVSAERQNVTLLCLLDATNTGFVRFYVCPKIDFRTHHRLKENDAWLANSRPLHDLSQLCEVVRSVHNDLTANHSRRSDQTFPSIQD
jgi:DNA invertase Pin-like site-specific DNA recombinase